ncbi:hypothetical protein CspHIS471_0403200 [Cutaneotrichosporon sp. HIS471]|nr:hypothetical protein CspHIS471_0403200 [Cutaneotrichosporon sp. HIS471]
MATNPFSASKAAQHADLSSLIEHDDGTQAQRMPSEDTIAALLHARARAELPFTRVSPSGTDYVVVNPLRVLSGLNEEHRRAYQADIERPDGGLGNERQPSAYELAGRVWLLMARQQEDQTVLYNGLTGSGKSSTMRHTTSQIIHLASTTKVQRRLGDQVTQLFTVLEAFGHSKTALNPSASQVGKYLELHFSPDGALTGAQALVMGLNKSRIGPLMHEERTFHVFYQLLAGATPQEREELGIDDPDMYALLASSGCYNLPNGPFSDDATQLGELRAAFASLGLKPKHVKSIFSVLVAILLLSNLTFTDTRQAGSLGMTSFEERTQVVEFDLLNQVSIHLGVNPEELAEVLTNRTKWVSHDLASVFLDAEGAEDQRDSLMRDLYAILFAFVLEMANKRLAPDSVSLQIAQLDLPGWQSRTLTAEVDPRRQHLLTAAPLIQANGQNGFYEFSVNFASEVLHSYLLRRTFDDKLSWNADVVADGVKLPAVPPMSNIGCVELLRGGVMGVPQLAANPSGMIGLLAQVGERYKGEDRDEVKADVVTRAFASTFNGHPSYLPKPGYGLGPMPSEGRMFGINHWAGQVSYDATDFLDRNADILDKQLVNLLRGSVDQFITKLVSGPALATEGHPLDADIVVEAQVSVSPLRIPTAVDAHRMAGTPAQESAHWPIDDSCPQPVTAQMNGTLSTLFDTIDRTRVWGVHCLRPNDSGHANSFDRRRIKAQVRSLLIPDLINRRQVDYVAEIPLEDFCFRHALSHDNAHEHVEEFARSHGWIPGTDYAIGNNRIWMSWLAWREQDDLIRATESHRGSGEETLTDEENAYPPHQQFDSRMGSSVGHFGTNESMDNLIAPQGGQGTHGYRNYDSYGTSPDPGAEDYMAGNEFTYDHLPEAEKKTGANATSRDAMGGFVTKEKKHHTTEVIATSRSRRWWIYITWMFTWWIPSFLLKSVGRMKRPDVRMAWREKVTICMMIFLVCGTIIFYIIGFGRILCPDMDKAWNRVELATHQGENDYYAAIAGNVYDFSKFWDTDHSDVKSLTTSGDVMMQFAGMELTRYFPKPLRQACPQLVDNDQLYLQMANFTILDPRAVHYSGPQQSVPDTSMVSPQWWWDTLNPFLKKIYKGQLVFTRGEIEQGAKDDDKMVWVIYRRKVYDISDYVYTASYYAGSSGDGLPKYDFLNSAITKLIQQNTGRDVTQQLDEVLAGLSQEERDNNMNCLDAAFYYGIVDFRKDAKCTVQNYLLMAFAIMIMVTIGAKFLAALQLGGKRNPEMLDKFVICQVPCYTEGEQSLKRTIDSLAVLQYDDKRKLIFIICDGNIIGAGNNRTTPRIVLDILGVDPKLDPEPLMFKSIGDGSKKLNYGKVYSGLYEYEGHVVPYVVVVKVGKPTETSKPGNRGKRDSQVLLMQYLNRVHFDAPMCPLELEIYHQMRNVIGIDPTFYEYIFQVDADTTVMPESLNRLISCTTDDSAIIGICGETRLENERESLTTMIQVYEYYISHHLTKAFESLFGSVTCLPGCFSVYRIRTADKGRPVLISSMIIDEYSEPNVDTLHKKNLFSLGEDRYLTTLMMKHFPTYKMKFSPDAIAHTVAPSRWKVLLSQRRRWINSTIHNLAELLFLPEMCGFCLFSMRFVVFVDLLGTIILPATCTYLVYLIVVCATKAAPIPYISIGMIAAVYGLQMILFVLKREFMLIGWMFVYILAFPIYSFFLPCYSFWSMDDFSWGNTRQIVGEGSSKTVVIEDDEVFEESTIPYRTFKEYEANAWETTSLPSDTEKDEYAPSQYSRARGRKRFAPSVHSSNSHSNLHPGSGYSSRGPSPHPPYPQMGMGGGDWRTGSVYSQPFAPPPMAFGPNPFDSPAMGSDMSLRPPTVFTQGGMMGPGYGMRGSTYSLATTANPFQSGPAPNTDPNPTDETVLSALRTYLNSQDLMAVTKRSARDAIYGLFPNANLKDRAAWLNENIDKILSEP